MNLAIASAYSAVAAVSSRQSAEANEITQQFAVPEMTFSPPNGAHPEAELVNAEFVVRPAAPEGWSPGEEREFAELAARKVKGGASHEELIQFDELQGKRRRFKNPVSGVELIFQYERRKRELEVLQTLREYVDFIETSRHPKA